MVENRGTENDVCDVGSSLLALVAGQGLVGNFM